ncbi:MAG: glycosyltransferase family 4 protein [Verrucomicrobiota bacterium]
MKRILTLCSQPLFEARGSPLRVKAFLRALGHDGFSMDVVTLPIGAEVDLPDSVRLFRVWNLPGVREIRIGPSWPKFIFGRMIAVRGILLGLFRRYSSVHGIEDMGLAAWLVARVTGARFVFEKHSDPGSHRSESRMKNLLMTVYASLERFVCRRADVIIVTGPGLAKQVHRYRVRGEVHVISDVPSTDREGKSEEIPRWRELFGCHPNDLVVAYIGSFAEYQGVPLLCEAIRKVLRKEGVLRFVFVGGSREDRENTAKIGRECGCSERVVHLDRIQPDEVADFLIACDVLVSPRLQGGNTPLKVLDYLRSGRCILATDTAANRLVLDENVALLAPPDAGSLAEGIEQLAEDSEWRDRLGQNGRLRYEEKFGFDRFHDDLLKVFATQDRNRKVFGVENG